MEEPKRFAFVGAEQLTVVGRQQHEGEPAPNFCLDYVDLADQVVQTTVLTDSAGLIRLLNVVNSLERLMCQHVTKRWEALSTVLPPGACIYTVSMDLPQMQARWQDNAHVLHQLLSAHRCKQFGQAYGVWLKEWQLLQRSIFVIDRNDCIAYVEYVADQHHEPDYVAALQAIRRATSAV